MLSYYLIYSLLKYYFIFEPYFDPILKFNLTTLTIEVVFMKLHYQLHKFNFLITIITCEAQFLNSNYYYYINWLYYKFGLAVVIVILKYFPNFLWFLVVLSIDFHQNLLLKSTSFMALLTIIIVVVAILLRLIINYVFVFLPPYLYLLVLIFGLLINYFFIDYLFIVIIIINLLSFVPILLLNFV